MSKLNHYTLDAVEPRHVPEPYSRTHGLHRPSQAEVLPLALHRFEFTGSGAEYFRIWVVNLLLTILTLGVYSAWAKAPGCWRARSASSWSTRATAGYVSALAARSARRTAP